MSSATPLTALDDIAASQLTEAMATVIAQLRERGIRVETATSFLLDLSNHPYEAPRLLDGLPVHIDFGGGTPPWADHLIYCIQVHFAGAERWVRWESSRTDKGQKGFDIHNIVKRISAQVADLKAVQAQRDKEEQDRQLAEQRLAALGAAARVKQKGPLLLEEDNLRIEAIPERPGAVTMTLRTTYADAEKIAKDYRIFRQSRRKP